MAEQNSEERSNKIDKCRILKRWKGRWKTLLVWILLKGTFDVMRDIVTHTNTNTNKTQTQIQIKEGRQPPLCTRPPFSSHPQFDSNDHQEKKCSSTYKVFNTFDRNFNFETQIGLSKKSNILQNENQVNPELSLLWQT